MRRREVMAGLLLAAVAEPTNAQQRTKLPLVGLLDPGIPHLFDAFRDGMRILGHFENQNITFVHRSAEGRPEPIPALAAELVRLNVDVIVTAGTSTVRAAAQATSNIPIVFAALGDAVRTGIVDTLARPGANLTGLSFLNTEISPKRLEILAEIVPGVKRIAVFADPNAPRLYVEATEEAARGLGIEVQVIDVPRPDAFENAFHAAVYGRAQALNVLASAFFNAHRARFAELATAHRLPAMYETGEYVRAGGLMAYGPSLADMFRRAATYVDKILKGAKPGDLPVEQPIKFEFLINLKTASALGLSIPTTLLARADEVIE
jgi:putative tryptophan/tyrosine transport system substrate-binding protein